MCLRNQSSARPQAALAAEYSTKSDSYVVLSKSSAINFGLLLPAGDKNTSRFLPARVKAPIRG